MGNEPYRAATPSRSCARLRCCHSGARRPGRRRGRSSARPAHSRNRAANSDVAPSCRITSPSISSGSGTSQLRVRRLVGLREPHDEAVVGPHHLDVEARARSRSRADTAIAQGVSDLRAERREQAQPPVAQLVAHPLDHDRAVVGDGAGGVLLLGRGTARGWRRRGRRGRGAARAASARPPGTRVAAGARARRSPGRTRAAARARRPSRTASCPAAPARATRSRGRA